MRGNRSSASDKEVPRKLSLHMGLPAMAGVCLALLLAGLMAIVSFWNLTEAQAAGVGSISGRVTDTFGNPLQNVRVNVLRLDGYTDGSLPKTSTDAAGNYTLTGSNPGTWIVTFEDYYGNHLFQYYNGKLTSSTANPVTVTADTNTPGINASMEIGGSVSGTVTNSSGQPVPGVQVEVQPPTGYAKWVASATTDSAGHYSVMRIRNTGSYKVAFGGGPTGNYLGEYYLDKPDWASADTVAVVKGQDTPNTNVTLADAPKGTISGKVINTSGQPLQNIRVSIYTASGTYCDTGYTDVAGNYTAGHLTTGNYKVQFSDSANHYGTQYYNGKPDLSLADPVAVVDGSNAVGINAALSDSGYISGRVTNSSGQPLPEIYVCVSTAAGSMIGIFSPDANGYYSTGPVAAGSYVVSFEDAWGTYVTQYYNNKPDRTSADIVLVSAGSTKADINAIMQTPTPPCTRPPLSPGIQEIHWGSYADYLARNLTVVLRIENYHASFNASNVTITDVTNTNGVTMVTALPLNIGTIGYRYNDSVAYPVLVYHVPVGVNSFTSSIHVTAQAPCGTVFSYPS